MRGAAERLVALERLRGSVRVTLRARRWLVRWRAQSPRPWDGEVSTTMTANAIELAALTEFVALQQVLEAADHR
jgi:hypothetical protein